MFKILKRVHFRVEQSAAYKSVRRAFAMLMPIMLVGAAAVTLMNLPLKGYQDFVKSIGGGALWNALDFAQGSAFGFAAVFLVVALSYYYSGEKGADQYERVLSCVTAFACFVASYGGTAGFININGGNANLSSFGAMGIFTALIACFISVNLFHKLYNMKSKNFNSYWEGVDEPVKASINAIVPFAVCLFIFIAADIALRNLLGVPDVNSLIFLLIEKAYGGLSNSLAGGIAYLFALMFLWFFGVHGGNAMETVHVQLFNPANTDPTQIISKDFLDGFVLIGGCGTTFALLIALLIFSKTRINRNLAYGAAPFAVFNINEFIVYGLPIILNPMFVIPFMIVPMVSMVLSYFFTYIGFIPITAVAAGTVHWTTPPIISGYLLTGSVKGSVVQIIILAVGTAIYAPFVRWSERLRDENERPVLQRCAALITSGDENIHLLSRTDDVGSMVKNMLPQLKDDISRGNVISHYQPIMGRDGVLVGAEALLRWRYRGQEIYPPLAVKICEESGCADQLARLVISNAIEAAADIASAINRPFKISVNVSPRQLFDAEFIDWVITEKITSNYQNEICLEMTENAAVKDEDLETLALNIRKLKNNNIATAVDDFSMGSSSLRYLRTGGFAYVKIDGGLVTEVVENRRSRELIRSVVNLGKELGFKTVAEYVETKEIEEIILGLGVEFLQGWLYSKAVSKELLMTGDGA